MLEITLLGFPKLLETSTSTIQAILPTRLQFRICNNNKCQHWKRSLLSKTTLNLLAKKELARWINNLEFSNGRSIIQSTSQIVLQTDTSKKGVQCAKGWEHGVWNQKRMRKFKSVHILVDNLTTLNYLLKMREMKSQQFLTLSKEIWEYIFKHQIMITA